MRTTLAAVVVAVMLLGLATASIAAEAPAKAAAKPAAAPKKKVAARKPVSAATLKETIEGEDVRDFRSFCDVWMGKLRDRNVYNESHIAWDTKDGQVTGEYVNYGSDRTCSAREEPGKDPIGKITYREVRYRRQGSSPTAAMAGAGTIVEQTDVTEIFRFAKGRWQY
jgi:hypothetical protein